MIKIEAQTLEEAYKNASFSLKCSVVELKVEVVQYPSRGILGLFKKKAIVVAVRDQEYIKEFDKINNKVEEKKEIKENINKTSEIKDDIKKENSDVALNDTIEPESFTSNQKDEKEIVSSDKDSIVEIAKQVKKDINNLFEKICFEIDKIEVSAYDENTILIEFKGEDSALLIGKEGYRYKALSYMLFNWINTKYQVQLRLEIAEFLKNQEESISRYLVGVCENVDRDGRTQTKILDGVLVQIALKELRSIYPDKYVAIRSTRDGMKYIIVNDYHSN